MDLGLKGRVAVVTGASKGVGKGVARALAAEGVDVVLLARGLDGLQAVARDIAAQFDVQALPLACDVTQHDSVRAAVEEVKAHFPTVHIVVNNAGEAIKRQDREITWDDADWLGQVQIKTLGALRMIREFLPLLARDGTGRILNIAGASGAMAWVPALTYGLNNAALMHMAGYLAADLGKEGIKVNTIVPGVVLTEWREVWAENMAKAEGKTKEQWLSEFCRDKGILAGRLARVEEVGDMAAFLASDRGAYVNGAKIALDGGLTVNAR